jgi:hypothetical protein
VRLMSYGLPHWGTAIGAGPRIAILPVAGSKGYISLGKPGPYAAMYVNKHIRRESG